MAEGTKHAADLLRLVSNRGKIKQSDAAKTLGVKKEAVRRWSDYLKNKKLIMVRKRFLRDVELVSRAKPRAMEKGVVLPKGKKIVPFTKESFYRMCDELTRNFNGVMRLYDETNGQSHTAALLINGGDIIGASFEHLDTGTILFGEEAMKRIKEKLIGTSGDLEIFSFNDNELMDVINNNCFVLLESPQRLSTLELKIKTRVREWAEKHDELKSEGLLDLNKISEFLNIGTVRKNTTIEELRARRAADSERFRIGKGFSMIDFARAIPKLDADKAKRFEALRKKIEQPEEMMGPEKAKRLEELKRRRIDAIVKETDERKARRFEELKAKRAEVGKLTEDEEKELKSLSDLLGTLSKTKRFEEIKDRREKKLASLKEEVKIEVPKKAKEDIQVRTNIDVLYEMAKKCKSLKITDGLAKKLGVSKTQIEEWALILEEHNLLELHYPPIGEPEIRMLSKEG